MVTVNLRFTLAVIEFNDFDDASVLKKSDLVCSDPVKFPSAFVLFGSLEHSAIVCTDGLLKMDETWASLFPATTNLSQDGDPMVAPYHYDIDTRAHTMDTENLIYFQLFTKGPAMDWVRDTMRINSQIYDFEPYWAFSALWDMVAHKNQPPDYAKDTARFQCMLTCSRTSEHCFVLFSYQQLPWKVIQGRQNLTVFIKGRHGAFSLVSKQNQIINSRSYKKSLKIKMEN